MSDSENADVTEEELERQRAERKRKKMQSARMFVDDMAEASEEEDDEEEEEEEEEQETHRNKRQRLMEEEDERDDDFSHAALFEKEQAEEAARAVQALEAKYGAEAESDYQAELMAEQQAMKHASQDQQSREALLPSISDPKLWLVACDPGKETLAVLELMKKFRNAQVLKRNKMFAYSAYTTPASKGFVYVEADKEVHVKQAIRNIRLLKFWKVRLVPQSEMVQALHFQPKTANVQKNSWVRLKRGVYSGDLGLVVRTADQGTRLTVKVVPRIDMAALEQEAREKRLREEEGHYDDDDNKKKTKKVKSKVRPLARLVDISRLREMGVYVDHGPGDDLFLSYDMYKGNRYKHGFLYKDINIKSLRIDGVNPTKDEVDLFATRMTVDSDEEDEGGQGLGAKLQMPPPPAIKGSKFQKGDQVIVSEGDLKDLTGEVMSVYRDEVKMMPSDKSLHEALVFNVSELRKYFEVGNHVKVIAGKHKNETGMIVSVGDDDDDNVVVVYTDIDPRMLRVYSHDIVESTEVSTGLDSLGNYELHDLVSLGDCLGVIVKVEVNGFKLLTSGGVVRSIRLQDIERKKHSKFAAALDSQANQIVFKDIVRCVSGEHAGMQGTVKHIFRASIWIQSRQCHQNGGLFVTQAKHVLAVGKQQRNNFVPESPHIDGPRSRGPPPSAFQRRNAFANDPLLNQQVVVKGGRWKSFRGTVVRVSDDEVRVELDSNAKTVSVAKHLVRQVDAYKREVHEPSMLSARTPAHTGFGGDATPHHDALGGMTPRVDGFGGRTPSRTPGYDYGGSSGSKTPSHDVWKAMATPRHNPITPSVHEGMDDDAFPDDEDDFAGWRQKEDDEGGDANIPANTYVRATVGGREVEATVVSAADGQYRLQATDGSGEVTCAAADVQPVRPMEPNADMVVVLTGEHRGKTGKLMGVDINDDAQDGIVQIDGDIHILPLPTLGKHTGQ